MPDEANEVRKLQSAVEELSIRVAGLEQRLSRLEQSRSPVLPIAPPLPASEKPEKLESRLGLTIVNRIGAVTLAIGIIFFFKYAADNAWIGALGRVILGLLAGLVLIGVAEWLRQRDQRVFSQGIAGCGLAILYISLYASFAYYQLVSDTVAFLSMVGASALAVTLSFRYQHPAIAALGLIGAFLTPPLLRNGEDQPWLLFPYLTLLDAASVEIALRKRWPVLSALALAGTAILFMEWASPAQHKGTATGLFFLFAFFALFLMASIRSFQRQGQTLDLVMIALNAFWTILSAWILLDKHHPGSFAFVTFLIAAVHLALAFSFRHMRRLYTVLYVTGHSCFPIAALQVLAMWAEYTAAPANRTSLTSEFDSVALAMYAVVMITLGVLRSSIIDRRIGLALLGIVIAKLYLYDVWLLTRFYRISAFVALGVLLLAASYMYSRFKDKLDLLLTGKQEEDRAR
jgi:uncharacterized membrane protein